MLLLRQKGEPGSVYLVGRETVRKQTSEIHMIVHQQFNFGLTMLGP